MIFLEELVRILNSRLVSDGSGDQKEQAQADESGLEDIVEAILSSRYRPLRARYQQWALERNQEQEQQQEQHKVSAATVAATSALVGGARRTGEGQQHVESLLAVPSHVRDPELAAYSARPKEPVGGPAGLEFAAAVALAQAEPNISQKAVEGLCARSPAANLWEREQRPLLSQRAEQAATAFIRGGWPTSSGTGIRLQNFIEDIVGRIVGDNFVEPFLELCVAKRSAAPLQRTE